MPDEQPAKRWLADFDVLSNFAMPTDSPQFAYRHPAGHFEAHLSNEPNKEADHTLNLRVIVSAASMYDVSDIAEEHAKRFLHQLAFLTQGSFRIARLKKVIDWTAGVQMRDMLFYTDAPTDKVIGPLLPGFFASVERLDKAGLSETAARALRWYSGGIRAPTMEDQFQFFWFVVELTAEASGSAEKVADLCQTCRGELFCSTCNTVSRHRPFQKQRIRALLEKVELPTNLTDAVFEARNRLMHGATREELEAYAQTVFPKAGFKAVVDTIGEAARRTIITILPLNQIPEGLMFASMNTYVGLDMGIEAHIQTVLPGDPNNPSFDQIDNIGITVQIKLEPRDDDKRINSQPK